LAIRSAIDELEEDTSNLPLPKYISVGYDYQEVKQRLDALEAWRAKCESELKPLPIEYFEGPGVT